MATGTTPAGAVVDVVADSKPAVQSGVLVQCLIVGIPAAVTAIFGLLSPPYNWPLIIATGTAAFVTAIAGILRKLSSTGTVVSGIVNTPK